MRTDHDTSLAASVVVVLVLGSSRGSSAHGCSGGGIPSGVGAVEARRRTAESRDRTREPAACFSGFSGSRGIQRDAGRSEVKSLVKSACGQPGVTGIGSSVVINSPGQIVPCSQALAGFAPDASLSLLTFTCFRLPCTFARHPQALRRNTLWTLFDGCRDRPVFRFW